MGVNCEDVIKEREKERAEQLDRSALVFAEREQNRAHVLPSICQLVSESNPRGVDKTFVEEDWYQWNSLLKQQGFTVTSQPTPPSFYNKEVLEHAVWETFWNVGTYLVGPTHEVTEKEDFAKLNMGSFIPYCGHGLSPESQRSLLSDLELVLIFRILTPSDQTDFRLAPRTERWRVGNCASTTWAMLICLR